MKNLSTSLLLVLLMLSAQDAHASPDDTCRIFLLKQMMGDVGIETVVLDPDEMKVFPVGKGTSNIALLLPFGPGKSGNVVQRSTQEYVDMVQCKDGELHVTVRKPDGSERKLPIVRVADWSAYDMRINVTGPRDLKRAFLIREGIAVEAAGGPVIDLFAGMVPLESEDYAITTEVTLHEEPPHVSGKAPLLFDGRHLFAMGRTHDGNEGAFVVDLGAGSTVVSEEFLPEESVISRLEGVEYSERGARRIDGVARGLGGPVDSFLGKAVLPSLTVGSVTFRDVSVSVVRSMPDLGGRAPVGILGFDLLRRAEKIVLEYSSEAAESPMLIWGDASVSTVERVVEAPFSVADNHIFVDGGIGDVHVSFLLDTGARVSMLPPEIAARAGLSISEHSSDELRGLDSTAVTVRPATIDRLSLGNEHFAEVVIHVGEFDVLRSRGLQERCGILGNDFLQRFTSIHVDFRNQRVLFATE